jgi:hypothetical protein
MSALATTGFNYRGSPKIREPGFFALLLAMQENGTTLDGQIENIEQGFPNRTSLYGLAAVYEDSPPPADSPRLPNAKQGQKQEASRVPHGLKQGTLGFGDRKKKKPVRPDMPDEDEDFPVLEFG